MRLETLLLASAVGAAMLAAPPAARPGLPSADASSPIARENARPGSRGWFVSRPAPARIAAYCDEGSYVPGQRVVLRVDSNGHRIAFAVYRLGWYGGAGGRLVLDAPERSNGRQPRPRVLDDRPGGAKLVHTGWHRSAAFSIAPDWPSGFYLVRVRDVVNGAQSYASFVVRAVDPAPIVVVLATSTWQAYNTWGGVSLYRDLRLSKPAQWHPVQVAHVVTTRRPYVQGYGAGDFFHLDQPLASWLERRGDDVSYATDYDAAVGRLAGPRTRIVLLSGHSEYHDAAEQAFYRSLLARGVDLAMLGGNNFVWNARFSRGGHRLAVWRMPRLDPHAGRGQPTVRWSALGMSPRALSGVAPVHGRPAPLRVMSLASWPWRGTGARGSSVLGQPLGAEWDGLGPGIRTPASVRVLASAPIVDRPSGARVAWVLRSLPGGSFVISFSEVGFNWRLAPPLLVDATWINASAPVATRRDYPERAVVSTITRRVVANVLARALHER